MNTEKHCNEGTSKRILQGYVGEREREIYIYIYRAIRRAYSIRVHGGCIGL